MHHLLSACVKVGRRKKREKTPCQKKHTVLRLAHEKRLFFHEYCERAAISGEPWTNTYLKDVGDSYRRGSDGVFLRTILMR